VFNKKRYLSKGGVSRMTLRIKKYKYSYNIINNLISLKILSYIIIILIIITFNKLLFYYSIYILFKAIKIYFNIYLY